MNEELPKPIRENKSQGTSESLRVRQEFLAAGQARLCLENKQYDTAMQLASGIQSLNVNIYSTLAEIALFDPKQTARALEILHKRITSDHSAIRLLDFLSWVRKPVRKEIFQHLDSPISDRIRAIFPEWNGELPNTLQVKKDAHEKAMSLSMKEIAHPEDCLTYAATAPFKKKPAYLRRYRELKGNEEDPRYLKIRLNNITHEAETVTKNELLKLMVSLSKQLGPREFRKWAERNSNWGNKRGENDLESVYGRYVLATYCAAQQAQFSITQWQYVARVGLRIDDEYLRQICYARVSQSDMQNMADTVVGEYRKIMHNSQPNILDPQQELSVWSKNVMGVK